MLPLSQSSVTRALSQRTLSSLLPGPVQVSFCAAADPAGELQISAQLPGRVRTGSRQDQRVALFWDESRPPVLACCGGAGAYQADCNVHLEAALKA